MEPSLVGETTLHLGSLRATMPAVMAAGGEGGSKRVLVVEDEEALCLLCHVNLELVGHAVTEARSLSEARAAIEAEIPDVVLLDLRLGHEDGLELLDEIEALDLASRVVLFSGSSEVGPELRARVGGVLGKPFALESLNAVVGGVALR